MSASSAYLIGRKRTAFNNAEGDQADILIAAERLDKQHLTGRRFHHCTFANVSFLDAVLQDCRFDDCAFLACYFRHTRIVNCTFVGAKFVGCEFPKPAVQSSDFRYAQFENCAVSFEEMEHCLPREPNLRENLSNCLAVTSEQLGFTSQARRYRLSAIQARDEHLWAAVLGKSEWYRDHYDLGRRIGAALSWLASKLNGLLWGHGERWAVLARNLGVAALVLFPIVLWTLRDGIQLADGRRPGVGQIVWLSVTTTIPVDGINSLVAASPLARVVLTLEAFMGIVIAGLFVTLLVRRALRR